MNSLRFCQARSLEYRHRRRLIYNVCKTWSLYPCKCVFQFANPDFMQPISDVVDEVIQSCPIDVRRPLYKVRHQHSMVCSIFEFYASIFLEDYSVFDACENFVCSSLWDRDLSAGPARRFSEPASANSSCWFHNTSYELLPATLFWLTQCCVHSQPHLALHSTQVLKPRPLWWIMDDALIGIGVKGPAWLMKMCEL